jgi:hypothetical protein
MGLNMNATGKERIVKRIAKNIIKTLTSQMTPLSSDMEGRPHGT